MNPTLDRIDEAYAVDDQGTFVARPAAAPVNKGMHYTVTDQDLSWTFRSNGSTWVPAGCTPIQTFYAGQASAPANGSEFTIPQLSITVPFTGTYTVRATGSVEVFYPATGQSAQGTLRFKRGSSHLGFVALPHVYDYEVIRDSGHFSRQLALTVGDVLSMTISRFPAVSDAGATADQMSIELSPYRV